MRGTPSIETRMKNTYIGGHIERVEDLRFLRGRGQFIADLDRAGQWHAAILRSRSTRTENGTRTTSEAIQAPARDNNPNA